MKIIPKIFFAIFAFFLISPLFAVTEIKTKTDTKTTAQIAKENDAKEQDAIFKDCVDGWKKGLSESHPEIAERDVNYLAGYYCLCGFETAPKIDKSLDTAAKQKQTYRKCMPYAVLRNVLQYNTEESKAQNKPITDILFGACKYSFPHNQGDKEDSKGVSDFCMCAVKPIAEIKESKEKLSDEKTSSKVHEIADRCANNPKSH